MGNSVTRTDFEWVTQEEPHAKRRVEILSKYRWWSELNQKEILYIYISYHIGWYFEPLFSIAEKYPQIKKLFGVDPTFKWKVCGLVLIQILTLFVMQHQTWPIIILTGYLFGGVINHALMLGKFLNYLFFVYKSDCEFRFGVIKTQIISNYCYSSRAWDGPWRRIRNQISNSE